MPNSSSLRVAGLSYDLYTGFHQWRKVRVETGFSWEVLKGNLEQIPGLLQKMGRLAVFTNSKFGTCRMCRMFTIMCTLEHKICTRIFIHACLPTWDHTLTRTSMYENGQLK